MSPRRASGDDGQLAAIGHAVQHTHADVLLPVDEQAIRFVSVHEGTLSQWTAVAPVPATAAFDITRDKWLLADWLTAHAIPCPPTLLYQDDEAFDQGLSTLPFPVLIKPTQGSYGRGIRRFETPSALRQFFHEHVCSEAFIVQSFIRGYDIDCSVLCLDGTIVAYTIQKGFLDGYHPFGAPVGIEFLYDSETYDVVRRVMEGLRWSGIAHLDLRYDEREQCVKVIEINPRFWGSVQGSLTAGMNFPYLACLAGLQAKLPAMTYHCQRFVAGKAALRLLMPRWRRRELPGVAFQHTGLRFVAHDPLPDLWGGCVHLYHKGIPTKPPPI